MEDAAIIATAEKTLARLGFRSSAEGGVVRSIASPWSVWGSPVFHWALLGLLVTLAFSGLQRSSGQMGVAVGQSRPDEPSSYGIYSAGPLRGLRATRRSIRVDAFERRYETAGVDRGPTPTVSVLDAQGEVIKTQRVYPNNMLKTDSLTIYPDDYGLSATVAIMDANGTDTGRAVRLVDFSEESTTGTIPIGHLVINDESGAPSLKVFITVPLDRKGNIGYARVPAAPKARVRVTSMSNSPVLDRVLQLGEELALPRGGTLRLVGVDYYARLQIVDDASIPFLYAALLVAALGLGVATLSRQHIVLGAVVDTPDGPRLAVRMRLWRNVTSSRSEIESELRRALGGVEEGSTT
jgi:hypothetical protein